MDRKKNRIQEPDQTNVGSVKIQESSPTPIYSQHSQLLHSQLLYSHLLSASPFSATPLSETVLSATLVLCSQTTLCYCSYNMEIYVTLSYCKYFGHSYFSYSQQLYLS